MIAATHKVAIVTPCLVPHDAISEAAADTYRMLKDMPDIEVRLLSGYCAIPGLPATHVAGLAEMLRHRTYLDADVLIYHFGVHHPLFDALLVGNGHAWQVVRFHNVTPPALLEPSARPDIERAIRQMHNLERADVVWADSVTNLHTLREHGIMPPTTEVIPLVVDRPARTPLSHKRAEQVEILYLGRFVRSKGVLELLQALRPLEQRHGFRLRLIGNEAYSDRGYIAKLRAAAADLGSTVQFLGEVADPERDRLLREAHLLAIPSYHEGFCKPVVEGLRAGCVPIGFAAYNLPDICAGLGRLVRPGDIAALTNALDEVLQAVRPLIQGALAPPLPLDAGQLTADAFDRRVQGHIAQFERPVLQERTRIAVSTLLWLGSRPPKIANSRSCPASGRPHGQALPEVPPPRAAPIEAGDRQRLRALAGMALAAPGDRHRE